MAYTISTFDLVSPTTFTIADQNTDRTLPIWLISRGTVAYGLKMAENFVYLLENFASPNDGTGNPTALNLLKPLTGQCWFDKTNSKLHVNTGTQNAPVWDTILSSRPDGTQPVSPHLGDLWYDTVNHILKVYDTGTFHQFYLRNDATSLPTVDNSFNLGSGAFRFNTIYSATFQGISTSSEFADLAERYAANEPMEPGDVVSLGGTHEICKTVGYQSPDVFGVISAAPGLKLNAGAGDDATHPYVALTGRVWVKVSGKVAKGQRLVSSEIPGVAAGANVFHQNYLKSSEILGRALADKTSTEVGLLEVVVGVK